MKMNGEEVDKWSEKHVGSLALTRTILGFLNLLLAVVVIFKLFGMIWCRGKQDIVICAIELLNLLEGVAQILGDKNPLLTWNRYGGMKKRQSVMLVESWGGVQDDY